MWYLSVSGAEKNTNTRSNSGIKTSVSFLFSNSFKLFSKYFTLLFYSNTMTWELSEKKYRHYRVSCREQISPREYESKAGLPLM